MNSNPYAQLLEQNQKPVAQPQQQQPHPNPQTYIYSPQQYNPQIQQNPPQCTVVNQYHQHAVVPVDVNPQQYQVPQQIISSNTITNKNSFMLQIIILYIIQYAIQMTFVGLKLMEHLEDSIFLYDNDITFVFWIVLILTIILPIIIFNTKALQNNPQSIISVIIYVLVFAGFQVGLLTISNKKTGQSFGGYFWLALFEIVQIIFELQGLVQLVVLAILIKVRGDAFKFGQFRIIGVILSCLGSLIYIVQSMFLVGMVASLGIMFTFLFTFALERVSDDKFGLKQNQSVFGSFSVFVVMICPCVTRA